MNNKKRKGKFKRYLDNRHLFTGLLYCADCGSPMWYRSNRVGYICGKYAKHGKSFCTNHAIKEQHLLTLMREDIKKIISVDIDDIDIDKSIKKSETALLKNITNLESKVEKLRKRNSECIDLLLDQTITREKYHEYLDRNNKTIEELKSKINELNVQSKKINPIYQK